MIKRYRALVLALTIAAAGCTSPASMQRSYDQEPLVSASTVGTEVHHISRRTSLEARVSQAASRSGFVSADWSVSCGGRETCEPTALRLNLRSATCPGLRFPGEGALRLRLEGAEGVLYDGEVYYAAAEDRPCAVGGVWTRELITAPLQISEVRGDRGAAVFVVLPTMHGVEEQQVPRVVRGPIRGQIGDLSFELAEGQLLPLDALAGEVASWGNR